MFVMGKGKVVMGKGKVVMGKVVCDGEGEGCL